MQRKDALRPAQSRCTDWAAGWTAEKPWFDFRQEQEVFLLQTLLSGPHPTRIWDTQQSAREANSWTHLVMWLRTSGQIPPFRMCLHGVQRNYFAHFTFTSTLSQKNLFCSVTLLQIPCASYMYQQLWKQNIPRLPQRVFFLFRQPMTIQQHLFSCSASVDFLFCTL